MRARVTRPITRTRRADSTQAASPTGASGTAAASLEGSLVAEVICGPDCGPPQRLTGDRIIVGRDVRAEVTVDDPTVAPHHVLVAATDRGEELGWIVTPLVGATSVAVDDRTVSRSELLAGADRSFRLRVGSSTVEFRRSVRVGDVAVVPLGVRPSPRLVPIEGAADRWAVHRRLVAPGHGDRPDVHPDIAVPERPVSTPSPPGTAVVGAGVALAGALAVAAVLGNLMFAVFATVGAVAALALWAGSWVGVLRSRRQARVSWAAALERFEQEVIERAVVIAAGERHRAGGISDVLVGARQIEPGLDLVNADAPGLWSERWPVAAPGSWRRGAGADHDTGGDTAPIPLVVGRGRVEWQPLAFQGGAAGAAPPCDPELDERLGPLCHLDDVPVAIDVMRGRPTSVCGWERRAVVRSMIAQLAWRHGPADWRLVVVTDDPDRWSWVRALPQAAATPIVDLGVSSVDQLREIVDADVELARGEGGASIEGVAAAGRSVRVTVVVVDDQIGDLGGPNTAVRRLVASPAVVAIVLADHPPGWVHDAVVVRRSGAIDHLATGGSPVIAARAVGISAGAAARVAAALHRLVDPETPAGDRLPQRCDLRQLYLDPATGPLDVHDASAVATRWERAGSDPPPIASIGQGPTGAVTLDLVADGPHALIAGTTGSGKSELLRTLVAALAVESCPADLTFVLIDYKGGAAFDACARLPHVVGSVTDLDQGLAERALWSLDAELRRRSRLLRSVGATDLADYRARTRGGSTPLPRLVVVVDEFATLAKELPEFLTALVDVAQRGRSLGLHLILATQRPAGAVNDDIRANTALRVALRTQESAESSDVLGSPDAARLPRATPGRALRVVGAGELEEFQVASCAGVVEDRGTAGLASIVDAVRSAWATADPVSIPRPWLPPLPERIAPEALAEELIVDAVVPALPATSSDASRGAARSAPGRSDDGTDRCTVPPVGVIDDPAGQRRLPLRWCPGDGTLLIVGAPGSGTTSTLLAVGAAACSSASPDELHLYVIDARGDHRLQAFVGVAHCGGVVRPHETERLRRLIDRVGPDRRPGVRPGGHRTIVLIDGLDALRHQLHAPGPDGDADLAVACRELLVSGDDRGVDVVATAQSDAMPPGVSARTTWVGSVDEVLVARAVGWSAAPVSAATPGRFGIVSNGLVAQIALGAPGLAELPMRSAVAGGPVAVEALPDRITMTSLRSGHREVDPTRLVIGLDAASLRPTGPTIGTGHHLVLVGRPASGVTTALHAIERAWRRRHPGGRVVRLGPADDVGAVAPPEAGVEQLVVVDDAHRVPDPDGRLAAVIDGTAEGVSGTVIAAGVRLEPFRVAYGHWTRSLAAAERGLAFAASGEPPTDVFGVSPPRRPIVPQRPGLAWLVEGGSVSALQIATDAEPNDAAT